MYQQLLSELDNQSLIITVNQRLCAHLLLEYGKIQRSPVFCTPKITALNSWLKQQWEECDLPQQLLESHQVHWLWQQVIENSPHTHFILPITQIAHLVNEAYSQMHNWQVPFAAVAQSEDIDHQTFLNWSREFDELLTKHQAITTAHLASKLNSHLDFSLLPEKIYLVGFQDMPPTFSQLFKHAIPVTISPTSQTVVRTQATNNSTELIAMASWAKQLSTESNPKPRIGCVIPELQSLRKQTVEIFHRSFHEDHSPMTPESIYPFNISAGQPLLDYPIIHDGYEALLLLSEDFISTDKLRQVLASPYIFPLEDGMIEAAEFDITIRNLQLTTLPFSLLKKKLMKYPALQRVADFLSMNLTSFQFPSEWAQSFVQQLESIGWPGSQSLSSEEYQLLSQWINQLQALSCLDDFSGPISRSIAISHLHYLLSSVSFQPQTDHSNANIQVLGLLEAAGLPFDYLWIMGLDNSSWPPTAQNNPFIPQALQKIYKLPHNSSEHELIYTMKLQASLIAHSKHTILSSPMQDSSTQKQPSALITSFNLESITYCDNEFVPTGRLENFYEDYAPILMKNKKLKGGTDIASDQAACPFRAFARHRLGTQSPRDLFFGVSPLLHGTLLHEVLERIWHELQSQKALLALNEEKQLALIRAHVDAATREKENIPARFLQLEKERLMDQIQNWLNMERERPPFFVVAIEKTEKIFFKDHEMTVRMDRIDQLPDKSLVVLDYKTSRVANPIKWLASPPLESQLPFYACFSQDHERIVGCGYALINRDGFSLNGFVSTTHAEQIPMDTLKTVSQHTTLSDWSNTLRSWKKQLGELMDSFIGGYAAVDPNPVAKPCDHCELSTLCRIEEHESI